MKLFRKRPPKEPPEVPGPRLFAVPIVGESHYQAELRAICGGIAGEHQARAAVMLEDSNPYDPQAVRVAIAGRTVGYLGRDSARQYRRWLSKAYPKTQAITCQAEIRGGWKRSTGEPGNFGVWLDLPTW